MKVTMAIRTVRKVITGKSQYDGAGVKLVRVIGYNDVEDFDPFLMMDAFDSYDSADYIKGFPWHPHRGIETVTYLIHGNIEHGDSLGNKDNIVDGGCQWMTAGSGIIHQEMPQDSERMLGIQLWLNLPQKDKMTAPRYHDITKAMIPVIQKEEATVRVISGDYEGTAGAGKGDHIQMLFLDVTLKAGSKWLLQTGQQANLFIYIVDGEGCFEEESNVMHSSKRGVLFNHDETFFARASEKGLRFFLFAGNPLKEPIAWGGPIVMNTQEELQEAFLQIDNGTFIK